MNKLIDLLLTSNIDEFLKLNDLTTDIFVYKKHQMYIYYIPTKNICYNISYILENNNIASIKEVACNPGLPYKNFDIKKTVILKFKSPDHRKEIEKFYEDNDPKLNIYLKAPNFTILDSYIFEKYLDNLILKDII